MHAAFEAACISFASLKLSERDACRFSFQLMSEMHAAFKCIEYVCVFSKAGITSNQGSLSRTVRSSTGAVGDRDAEEDPRRGAPQTHKAPSSVKVRKRQSRRPTTSALSDKVWREMRKQITGRAQDDRVT